MRSAPAPCHNAVASHLARRAQAEASRSEGEVEDHLGFGRIVASKIEAPNMLMNMV
jgi:hypothetical protein